MQLLSIAELEMSGKNRSIFVKVTSRGRIVIRRLPFLSIMRHEWKPKVSYDRPWLLFQKKKQHKNYDVIEIEE